MPLFEGTFKVWMPLGQQWVTQKSRVMAYDKRAALAMVKSKFKRDKSVKIEMKEIKE